MSEMINKKPFRLTDDKVTSEINPVYVTFVQDYVDTAIFLRVASRLDGAAGTTLSTAEARELAAALIKQADEFDRLLEASKPTLPTEPGLYITGDRRTTPLWAFVVFALDPHGFWTVRASKVTHGYPTDEAYVQHVFDKYGLDKLTVEEKF